MKISVKRMRLAALIFSAAIICRPLSGQDVDSAALAEEYFQQGMATYDFTHRKLAKEIFMQVLQYDPDHAKAHYMIGKSIMLTVHKQEALPFLLRAIELDPQVDEEAFLYIGMAYHQSYQFDKAIEYYQLHRKKLIRALDFERAKQVNIVDRKIFECYNAQIFVSHPIDVKISTLGSNINSEYPDYAPAVSADESVMVFTSRRDDNINPDVAEDHEYYEDIFISRKENGRFGPAKNIGAPINTSFHNASITLSPDGKQLFIYSSVGGGDIYESDLQEDGTWTRPKAIPGEVNSPYLESSVSETADGQQLYFTSDRPGGFGGTDVYVATRLRNGEWVDPVNLGPVINTEMDEDGVFISANGQHLYFSSNGHAGMGDLDIYRALKDPETGDWMKPDNLGYPINTVENDIYFSLSGDEKTAYYSSVRFDSEGEQDIYMIDMTNFSPVRLEEVLARVEKADPIVKIPDSTRVNLTITVIDKKDLNLLEAAIKFTRESSGSGIEPQRLDSGKYLASFYITGTDRIQVDVSNKDYDAFSFPVYVLGKGKEEINISETVRLGTSEASNVNLINVYFELNSAEPKSLQGVHYLELMLKEQPDMHVEISGHTDNTGDAEYNKQLSLRRAEAVKKYLVGTGIAAGRISTVGYGQEKPMASNETLNGRQLNRRTEFRIISNLGDTPLDVDH